MLKVIALLTAATACLMVAAAAARADVWTLLKNSSLPSGQTDAAYTLPVSGLDLRVYEFTPKSNPNITCVTAYGRDQPAGLQCFAKPSASN